MPYARALRHHLAGPLGIQELAFCADEALLFRTAIGHGRPSPEAAQRPLKAWAVMPPSNPAAGNQLAMSARGLIAFARMHLADGLAPDGTRLLSKASARAMRERQIDHPAAIGAPKWAGPGLDAVASTRGGRARRGHDRRGLDAANGAGVGRGDRGHDQRWPRAAHGRALDPLLGDLAAVPPAPQLPAPDAGARVAEHQRYLGRYQTRPTVHDVTLDEAGRLWLTSSSRNEALTMEETAGVPSDPERHELRPVGGDASRSGAFPARVRGLSGAVGNRPRLE